MTHNLKTWPKFFEMVRSGRKTFELRVNDRNFQIGDTLVLAEWIPEIETYTGREERRMIADVIDLAPLSEYVALVFENVQPMILRYRAEKAEAEAACFRKTMNEVHDEISEIMKMVIG